MITIKEIPVLLCKAGLLPTILVLGGFIYSAILIILLLYNLVFGNAVDSSHKNSER